MFKWSRAINQPAMIGRNLSDQESDPVGCCHAAHAHKSLRTAHDVPSVTSIKKSVTVETRLKNNDLVMHISSIVKFPKKISNSKNF